MLVVSFSPSGLSSLRRAPSYIRTIHYIQHSHIHTYPNGDNSIASYSRYYLGAIIENAASDGIDGAVPHMRRCCRPRRVATIHRRTHDRRRVLHGKRRHSQPPLASVLLSTRYDGDTAILPNTSIGVIPDSDVLPSIPHHDGRRQITLSHHRYQKRRSQCRCH